MSDEKKPQQKRIKIDIKLDDEVAQGTYVNMARIFHSQTEFVLDALYLPPQSRQATVRSRIILNPVHAKFLQAALAQNISLYEQKFGPIEVPKQGGGEPGPIIH